MQKISQMGTMYQKLTQYMELALTLAQAVNPMLAEQIAQDVIQSNGGAGGGMPMGGIGGVSNQILQGDSIGGIPKKEHAIVSNARQKSNEASQPDSDGAVNTKR